MMRSCFPESGFRVLEFSQFLYSDERVRSCNQHTLITQRTLSGVVGEASRRDRVSGRASTPLSPQVSRKSDQLV
jgi:hypothetical protein